MKKGLLKTLFLTFIAVLLLGTEKTKAGHDMGTLSKDNPCVYAKFTLQKGEEFLGGFFSVSDDVKDAKLSIVNLSKGDISLKTVFADITGEREDLKTFTFKKGKKKIEFSLPEMKEGERFFIEGKDIKYYDQEEITIGICVYSEKFGGAKHDFTKLVLSKDELTLNNGQSVTLKVTLDKTLKKGGVIWSTSDKNVVTVSKKGKLKAVGAGWAIITCTSKKNKEISAQCMVMVEEILNVGEVTLKSGYEGNMFEYTYLGGKISKAQLRLTLESNGYSGWLVLNFGCSDGVDSKQVYVEKHKTYYIDYYYNVTEDTSPNAQIKNITLPVEIEGGTSLQFNAKFNGTINKGYINEREA